MLVYSVYAFGLGATLLLVPNIPLPLFGLPQASEVWIRVAGMTVIFLASFFYVGIIWLNHRAVFSRVRYCNRSLHLANLILLPNSALIPFPTAVLSMALQTGTLAKKAYDAVRAKSAKVIQDRPLAPEIEAVSALVAAGTFSAILH